MVLAGGEGKRLAPLTADRAKPAVPFGGNYRLIDFALSNLVNAGLPPDRRAHAVQEPLARPPRRDDLAAVAAAGQLRHAGPGADAPRAALVRGLGRRDLPEPQPDLTTSGPEHIIVFGADHIYRMDPRQMVEQHVASGAGVTVAALRVPIEQADQFGVIETARGRARRSRPSARSRRTPVGLPDAPGRGLRLDGQLRLHHRGADRRGHRRRRRRELQATTSAATSSRCSSPASEAQVYDFSAQRGARARPTATAATGATSGRSTPTTTRTWTSSRSTRSSTSTTTSGRSSRWPEPLPPAKFVFDEDGPARPRRWTRWSARASSSRGGDRAPLGAVAGRARALLRAGRGLDPHARRRRRPRARSCAGRSSTRTCAIERGRADRRRPRGATARASTSPPAASSSSARARGRRREASPCSRASTRRRSTAARACTSSTWRASSRGSMTSTSTRGAATASAQPPAHAARGTRSPATAPHLAALRAMSIDLTMAAGAEGADLAHTPHLVREPRRAPREARATTSRTSRPSTASSRCGRGRPSSSAAATRCRASASARRWRTPTR